MQNKLIKMGMVAAMVMTGVSAAHAGDQPQVTITGDVSAVSCTVNASASQNSVSLGNRAASQFAAGAGIYSHLHYVADTKKTFSVGLSGCSGNAAKDGVVSLMVTGTPIAGADGVYSGGQNATVGTAGASLAAPLDLTKPNEEALITNGTPVPVYKFVSGDTSANGDGKFVTFTTYMASTSANPAPQHIEAPLNFSIAYN